MNKPSLPIESISLIGSTVLANMIIGIPWYFLTGGITIGTIIFIYSFININDTFDKLFTGLKFYNAAQEMPRLIKKIKTEFGHDYTLTLPPGLNLKHFENIKLSIEQYLDAKIKIRYREKNIYITALEIKLSDYYPFEFVKCDPMEIVLGYTAQGLKKFKLKSHMLICGASGFGKSTLERSILVLLILNSKPSKLILNLCDFKRNELGLFKRCKHVNTFVYDIEGLNRLLDRLENEAKRRYELFEQENILDIERYNKSHKQLPYIVTIIDEIAQLEGDKKLMSKFQKRISYDRAAGLIYIICTQRPSVDLLPGSVKANIDTRVCFHTVDSTNSWIVLDDKEAAQYLELPGRGLLRSASIDLEEFQAMYISEDEVTEQIKHTFRRDTHDNREGPENN